MRMSIRPMKVRMGVDEVDKDGENEHENVKDRAEESEVGRCGKRQTGAKNKRA